MSPESSWGRKREVHAAEVTMTNHWMCVLLEPLHDLSFEHRTTVVLVSAHGDLVGDYGWTGKIASILHPPLIHVPFVMGGP
jgi:hypothetical protein